MREMIGRVVSDVTQTDDEIEIKFKDGSSGRFYHSQDCCEHVRVEDVNGSWSDLIGHPLLVADERVQDDAPGYESATWTFYTFRSVGGSVDVRWVGESNGYYSESVDFYFTESPEGLSEDGSFVWPKKTDEGWFQ